MAASRSSSCAAPACPTANPWCPTAGWNSQPPRPAKPLMPCRAGPAMPAVVDDPRQGVSGRRHFRPGHLDRSRAQPRRGHAERLAGRHRRPGGQGPAGADRCHHRAVPEELSETELGGDGTGRQTFHGGLGGDARPRGLVSPWRRKVPRALVVTIRSSAATLSCLDRREAHDAGVADTRVPARCGGAPCCQRGTARTRHGASRSLLLARLDLWGLRNLPILWP